MLAKTAFFAPVSLGVLLTIGAFAQDRPAFDPAGPQANSPGTSSARPIDGAGSRAGKQDKSSMGQNGTQSEKIDIRRSEKILAELRRRIEAAEPAISPEASSDLIREAIGLSEDNSLQLVRSSSDRRGNTHLHYQRRVRGVPVWGEEIVVTRDGDGDVTRAYGTVAMGLAGQLETTQPKVGEAEVLKGAKDLVRRGYGIAPGLTFQEDSVRLVVYNDEGSARLSYEVTLFADIVNEGNPTNPTFIFDAQDGHLIRRFEGLRRFAAPEDMDGGRAADRAGTQRQMIAPVIEDERSSAAATDGYGTGPGGNEKTTRYTYGGTYDPFPVTVEGNIYIMRAANVQSVNLIHGTSGTEPFRYNGPENTYKEINGAYSPINDAQFFGNAVYQMCQAWYGIDPLSVRLTQWVHYGRNHENAHWFSASKTMAYGDGYRRFYPLVSLDVCAHEVMHGFTDEHSDLIYDGQSGGMNEAFSDMAGEAAENYMRGNNDFEVGASIFKRPGEALRYMSDPPRDGRSIDSANDYYEGLDVHYSSGVYNKAFYTLATRWDDVRKSFNVFMYANQHTWTPNETFVTAATKVVDAAEALGYPQEDVEDVRAAFAAVDINL
jgi:Zn-dependent metalloprotease